MAFIYKLLILMVGQTSISLFTVIESHMLKRKILGFYFRYHDLYYCFFTLVSFFYILVSFVFIKLV